jgi:hypothetical protein
MLSPQNQSDRGYSIAFFIEEEFFPKWIFRHWKGLPGARAMRRRGLGIPLKWLHECAAG